MPSKNKWLAKDSTYQQQKAGFYKSKKDYDTQYRRQRSVLGRDYKETQRSMNRQAVQDRDDQKNNFAGRGILKSGVFAKALGDYNTEFQTKIKNLLTGKTDSFNDLSDSRTNFLRQLRLEQEAARQDALRRRATRLGI